MGRAINKTIIIVELLKVKLQPSLIVSQCGIHLVAILMVELFMFPWAEKDCWPPPEYLDRVTWYNWHLGAVRGGPCHVRSNQYFPLTSFYFRGRVCFDMISFCTRDSLETTRHVSLITIKLSKKELDTSSPGLVELCLIYLTVIEIYCRVVISYGFMHIVHVCLLLWLDWIILVNSLSYRAQHLLYCTRLLLRSSGLLANYSVHILMLRVSLFVKYFIWWLINCSNFVLCCCDWIELRMNSSF
jgi:hypothetical protein